MRSAAAWDDLDASWDSEYHAWDSGLGDRVWTLKEKTGVAKEIQTPDGYSILVGALEDEILIYEEGIFWTHKQKEL